MRLNTPVTNIEFEVSDTQTIISTTDLKGNITYANPYFVEASGYSEEELIGAPQNILRHPDMPASAFADMWATIKSGMPWSGMVKNRRKNGDYYWVLANVTPVVENGSPIGYMSVRTKPTRDQVRAAAELYRKAANGYPLTLRQGRVIRPGLLGKIIETMRLSMSAKIGLILSFLLVSIGGYALVLWSPELRAKAGFEYGLGTAVALNVIAIGWLWYFMSQMILAPLKQVIRISQRMSGGDMTAQIETTRTDEMGQMLRALRQMNIVFRSILGDVRDSFVEMREATREISSGNRDLSARTDSQAAALEQTAASMEELASTVQQNADRATEGNQVVNAALDTAQKGGVVMQQMVATIGEISESSGKISEIVGLINGIAAQTNLLALNAAVEAARAGEAGRGFAVVAAEVRDLAQRCSTAAMEIRQLINASTEKVSAGTVLARDAGQTMQDIIEAVNRVNGIMNDVSSASVEQSGGIGQVNEAVTQMDGVTQQNASLVEEAAKAASNLEESVRKFMQALNVFKLHQSLPKRESAAKAMAESTAGENTVVPLPTTRPASKAAAERRDSGRRGVRGNLALAAKPRAEDQEF
jgi:aerotaxis receptor